jgi:hypothetical protein
LALSLGAFDIVCRADAAFAQHALQFGGIGGHQRLVPAQFRDRDVGLMLLAEVARFRPEPLETFRQSAPLRVSTNVTPLTQSALPA